MNYNFGTLTDWVDHSMGASLISVCDEKLIHGVYDTGSSPSMSLFNTPEVSLLLYYSI